MGRLPIEPPVKEHPWGPNDHYEEELKKYLESKRARDFEDKIISSISLAFGIVLLIGFAVTLYIQRGLLPFIAILLFTSLTLFIFKRLKE